jgi:hypothetical protein
VVRLNVGVGLLSYTAWVAFEMGPRPYRCLFLRYFHSRISNWRVFRASCFFWPWRSLLYWFNTATLNNVRSRLQPPLHTHISDEPV